MLLPCVRCLAITPTKSPHQQVFLYSQCGKDLPTFRHPGYAPLVHLVGKELVERPAAECDRSPTRLHQPHNGSDDAGLASAIGTQDCPDLALVDFEVDPPHGAHRT